MNGARALSFGILVTVLFVAGQAAASAGSLGDPVQDQLPPMPDDPVQLALDAGKEAEEETREEADERHAEAEEEAQEAEETAEDEAPPAPEPSVPTPTIEEPSLDPAVAAANAKRLADRFVPDIPEAPGLDDVPLPVDAKTILFGDEPAPEDEEAATQSTATQASREPATPYIVTAAVAGGLLLAWAAKTGGIGAGAAWVSGSNAAHNAAMGGRPRVIPAPLFTRFQKDTVLDHPKRSEIYSLVAERPGIHLQSLCDETGLSRTAVTHHLRLLEKQHMIVSKKQGRSIHFYQNGGRYGSEMKQAYAVLQNERSNAIAQFIQEHPGAIQKNLCGALGIDASVAHWHVKRLREANLVDSVRQGRTVAYFPSAALQDAVAQSPQLAAPVACS